jgi:division protein CdvB (Snf7/Vps24/ESCRT-III family)
MLVNLNVRFGWIKGSKDKDDGDGGNAILNGTKVKPKLEEAKRLMQMQISKLDMIQKKLDERDKILFTKVTGALQERNMPYASILSNELAHVRNVKKMVYSVKLALEQIQLRLGTISDLGDIVVTLSPAMSIVKGIRHDIGKLMPEFDGKMQELHDTFSSIIVDTSQSSTRGSILTDMHLSEEAQSILDEATNVIADEIRARLPDLPQHEIELPELSREMKQNARREEILY